jgi:hypothetical protein
MVSAYPGTTVVSSNAGHAPDAPQAAAQSVAAVSAVASPTAQAPADIVMAAETDDQPKKKRGFWGRVFGRGDKDKPNDKDKPRAGNDFRQR